MRQTIKINNIHFAKQFKIDLQKQNAVSSKDTAPDSGVPEGYLSADTFWKQSRESIDNICKKHGLL